MFIVVPLIRSTGLAIVAEANLRCGVFCPKKFSSQWWQFFFLFGLDYQTFLEFSQIWKTGLLFWVDNAFCTCWCYLGVLNKWFQFFSVESCLFMCLSVMRFFSLQAFPILISVWLILSFRCAHFYSFIQFNWGRGHWTSEFALECFCLNKVVTNW